ncbi:hypothetical protein [Fodinibius halophilus]|uniref:Uncharacterized protein n=1 Tax=Fodinibius halophilus TaxID=1736908 RepID=A0A6M1T6D9_9BACT|nr:hypothetical protein [Fodinibius halophilus]NGP88213.1 hypothetical protein [Fodinibius halophilus]
MFFVTFEHSPKHLSSLAQADSLIQTELSNFNIRQQQVRVSTIPVNPDFKRKKYHLGVPFQFSKTHFHAELNNRLHPYNVETPAHVTFPQEDMNIHLLYKETVIRTISLQTDPDLAYSRDQASLMIVFDEMPGESTIEQVQQYGEPIPIVLKINNPMQANEWRKRLGSRYNRIIFWLQNSNGTDLIKSNRSKAIDKLNQLQQVLPQAMMLYFSRSDESSADVKKEIIAKTKMTFVNGSNALILHHEMGKAVFFDKLESLQSPKSRSIALISGNTTTLNWLNQKLPELKKSGISIIPPPKANL